MRAVTARPGRARAAAALACATGRFICAQGPGIPNDLALRWVAERLSRSTGRPFFVDNILGAGGLIAGESVQAVQFQAAVRRP